MSAVHGLLSRLPEQLSYEQMVVLASQLYAKHPPKILARKAGLRLSTRWGGEGGEGSGTLLTAVVYQNMHEGCVSHVLDSKFTVCMI